MPNEGPTEFITKRHSTSYDYVSPLKLDLAGKHVVVTGAAWEDGVGYAIATAFARAGASAIVVIDLHGVSDELVAKLKVAATQAGQPEPDVLSCKVDIANLEDVRAMHDTIVQRFGGRIDVVINNAAHMEPYTSFLETDPTVYWRTWEVNLHGLFNMARAFLPTQLSSHASENALCTMINVASSGALSVRAGSSSYRTSKLAVLRWTETIKTKITEGSIPEQVRKRFPDRPDVAGDTIAWLAAERRDWLGGRYVSCPWDMEELMSREKEIVDGDKLKLSMML
jgi:NAD(P)-dependent dehydrogenase (short-subunit alcohol dehydrogenase family)